MAKKKSRLKKRKGELSKRSSFFKTFSDCVTCLKKFVYIIVCGRQVNNKEDSSKRIRRGKNTKSLTIDDFYLDEYQRTKYPRKKIIGNWLHKSVDHIKTGECLLGANKIESLDSAAVLIQYGFELLFKACLLEFFGCFKKTHELTVLCKNLTCFKLSNVDLNLLKQIDVMFYNRYPLDIETYNEVKSNNLVDNIVDNNSEFIPLEIGEIDTGILEKARILYYNLLEKLPENMQDILQQLDPLTKGNRVLMRKKIEDSI